MYTSTGLATALALLGSTHAQQYTLRTDYFSTGDFFSQWDFFTAGDPTNGFVDYVSQSTAQSSGLINGSAANAWIGVDSTNVVAEGSRGRASVRLTSKEAYSTGLVVLDLEHMPGSICGTWPAFWMFGPDWPNSGEVDVIEGVNDDTTNSMTLHTSNGCTIAGNSSTFSGSLTTSNCYVNAPNQSANQGCSIAAGTNNIATYGDGFNAANGGVYATEITEADISIWFFPRSGVPYDLTSGSPNPATWGTPLAHFQGGCDIASHFVDMNLVFDTTFCGDWAGVDWGNSASCASKADSCVDYVQNDPSAFAEAYWEVKSLKVYSSSEGSTTTWSQEVGIATSSPSATSPLASPSSSAVWSSASPSATLESSSSSTASSTTSVVPAWSSTAAELSTESHTRGAQNWHQNHDNEEIYTSTHAAPTPAKRNLRSHHQHHQHQRHHGVREF